MISPTEGVQSETGRERIGSMWTSLLCMSDQWPPCSAVIQRLPFQNICGRLAAAILAAAFAASGASFLMSLRYTLHQVESIGFEGSFVTVSQNGADLTSSRLCGSTR